VLIEPQQRLNRAKIIKVPLFHELSPDEVAQIMQLSGAQFTRFTGTKVQLLTQKAGSEAQVGGGRRYHPRGPASHMSLFD
jgi:hypothetical protein